MHLYGYILGQNCDLNYSQVRIFQIERRVEARINKWQDDVKEELRQQRQEALFKARPASVLEKAPFVPLPSDKPLSEIDNFQLNSDRRAEEREAYEMQKKHREAEQESLKRQVRGRGMNDVRLIIMGGMLLSRGTLINLSFSITLKTCVEIIPELQQPPWTSNFDL